MPLASRTRRFSPSPYRLDDFDVVAVVEGVAGVLAARHDFAIDFDRDAASAMTSVVQ